MNEKLKIILALQQIDNLTELIQNNEYQQFLYGHLMNMKVELKRQLNNYE